MNEGFSGPKVSVITPLYNSSAVIRATLDSLLAQTYDQWESILIDDGSTDDTAEVVKPYLADSRFSYLRREHGGIAAARNTGIAAASGEWICLLDHDDLWLSSKLAQQVRYASEYRCDIVCTDAFIVTEGERIVYSRGFAETAKAVQRSVIDSTVDVLEQLIKVNFICTSSVMIRRALFDEFGPLDQSVAPADDYDMWLRCAPMVKFGFVSEPLIEYVVHSGNYSRNFARILEYTIRVLQRHRKRFAKEMFRRRQFDQALVYYFEWLFRLDSQDRSVWHAVGRMLSLLKGGPLSLGRLMCLAVWAPASARAKNSASYRWELLRARAVGR